MGNAHIPEARLNTNDSQLARLDIQFWPAGYLIPLATLASKLQSHEMDQVILKYHAVLVDSKTSIKKSSLLRLEAEPTEQSE